MKSNQFLPLILVCLLTTITFTSCQAIGDIFKAGFWVGIIAVVLVVALILWLINRARK